MNTRMIMVGAALIGVMNSYAEEKPVKILCIGDSITAANQWVKTVGAHPAFETINAGQGGRRTRKATRILTQKLEEHTDVDRVIMFLGVNDLPARDKRPNDLKVSDCIKNMGKAIDLALMHFKPKDIILVAPCGINADAMSDGYREKGFHIAQPMLDELELKYKALATGKGVSFVSLLNVVSKENYRDGLHPNQSGQDQIAQAFLSFLTVDTPE